MNDHDLFDDLIGGTMTKTYDLRPSRKDAVLDVTAKKGLGPFVRFHADCPSCGYACASANETKGKIHCPSCHRTGVWPPERPSAELLAFALGEYLSIDGDSVSFVSKRAFRVTINGDALDVTVAAAA